MKALKQALLITLMALVVGVSVNFVRSDGLPVFSPDGEDPEEAEQISVEQGLAILKSGSCFFVDLRPVDVIEWGSGHSNILR